MPYHSPTEQTSRKGFPGITWRTKSRATIVRWMCWCRQRIGIVWHHDQPAHFGPGVFEWLNRFAPPPSRHIPEARSILPRNALAERIDTTTPLNACWRTQQSNVERGGCCATWVSRKQIPEPAVCSEDGSCCSAEKPRPKQVRCLFPQSDGRYEPKTDPSCGCASCRPRLQ